VANAGKLLLILCHGPLWSFAAANAAELALGLTVCIVAYRRSRDGGIAWCWSRPRALRLLAEAWPLAGAGMAIQVQAYFDQVLLGGLRGPEDVGVYAAALRLVTVFGFLPVVVANAAASEISRAHRDEPKLYLRRMRDVYRVMLGIGLLSILPLMIFPRMITGIVFGPAFAGAAVLLPLMALRVLLSNLGVARGLFITNEGLTLHALLTAGGGAVLNIVLNLILIPRIGAMGCVLVSLVSFLASIILFEFLNRRARLNLRLMAAAVGLMPLPSPEGDLKP
jgi:O-antigen/teichoic acid export membrane protein